jgi:L-ribulose-5-phosphate 3-epimerase
MMPNLSRRDFLATTATVAAGAAMLHADTSMASGLFAPGASGTAYADQGLKPMSVGLLISPADGPEATISRVKEMGFTNCFFSVDGYINKFTPALADQLGGLLHKHGVVATCIEVVGPGRLVWDFIDGPSTIGLVPRESRAARMDALHQASDFAKLLGIPRVQTHCGFIPENPKDVLYQETVAAIREVATHCAANGPEFLMETGQETPTTVHRTIMEVNAPNLGVGFDTANLILYGKSNPTDAIDMLAPYVKSVHAKDGLFPTDPMKLGEEVLIGKGKADFEHIFTQLHKAGYRGAITIERETSGPQQIADVREEKLYLEGILSHIVV